ncbi:glutamyl-tRNA(Gln) amidotransferase subunit A [Gammaproteobacteria bacterium]|nr:glutamyl-tRNA(Gln) amidotransferase subunit A [Gammaproteobacteria bacterium]
MKNQSIFTLSEQLSRKSISSVELTKYFLERIKKYNPSLNALITLTEDQALNKAAQADIRIACGNATALTGIAIAHKDLFCTEGVRTSCCSKMLDNFIAPYDAKIVSALDAAGAISLGKLNMDEFAMGASNETSFYGACFNPWDLKRVPGGSSGGSAAAVSAGLVMAATASDTGGSIRQPASFCGVTGIKPTYGRVSRYGMIAFASSLDQAGVIAKSAQDCALLLEVMAGFDEQDSTSMQKDVPAYSKMLNQSIQGLKIGVPKEFFSSDVDPDVSKIVMDALKELEKQGAILIEVSLPNTSLVIPAYYVIAPAEASSNLSRFDGVRYGFRCDNPKDLNDLYLRSRTTGFGDEVKRRIMIGTYALSAGFYDAYYLKAQQVRRKVYEDYQEVLKSVDVIAGPTATDTAPLLGMHGNNPKQAYLNDIFTIGANLAGLPAMSIPAGFSANLPVGLQLIGKAFDESCLLNLAHAYQQITNWHTQYAPDFE